MRIIKNLLTLSLLGLFSVGIFSDADAQSRWTQRRLEQKGRSFGGSGGQLPPGIDGRCNPTCINKGFRKKTCGLGFDAFVWCKSNCTNSKSAAAITADPNYPENICPAVPALPTTQALMTNREGAKASWETHRGEMGSRQHSTKQRQRERGRFLGTGGRLDRAGGAVKRFIKRFSCRETCSDRAQVCGTTTAQINNLTDCVSLCSNKGQFLRTQQDEVGLSNQELTLKKILEMCDGKRDARDALAQVMASLPEEAENIGSNSNEAPPGYGIQPTRPRSSGQPSQPAPGYGVRQTPGAPVMRRPDGRVVPLPQPTTRQSGPPQKPPPPTPEGQPWRRPVPQQAY